VWELRPDVKSLQGESSSRDSGNCLWARQLREACNSSVRIEVNAQWVSHSPLSVSSIPRMPTIPNSGATERSLFQHFAAEQCHLIYHGAVDRCSRIRCVQSGAYRRSSVKADVPGGGGRPKFLSAQGSGVGRGHGYRPCSGAVTCQVGTLMRHVPEVPPTPQRRKEHRNWIIDAVRSREASFRTCLCNTGRRRSVCGRPSHLFCKTTLPSLETPRVWEHG